MNSNLIFNIYFKTPGSNDEQVYKFAPLGVSTGNSSEYLTLQALYSDSVRYFISLSIDNQIFNAPAAGFSTISDLWSWIQQNWINLGSWYFLPTLNKFILYVKAQTGVLSISPLIGVQALFPTLSDGEFYVVQFNGFESPEETLYTISDVVSYVQGTWGNTGVWTTDGTYLIYQPSDGGNNTLTILASTVGAFSSGFSGGFTI